MKFIIAVTVACLAAISSVANAAVTCAPVFTAPAAGSVISGKVTFTDSAGCPAGTAYFDRLYIGPKILDYSGDSIVIDTSTLPANTNGAALIIYSPDGLTVYGKSAVLPFTIGVATPTPTPTASPSPVPTSTPAPSGCGFTFTANSIVANCPIVAPAFSTPVPGTPTPTPVATGTPAPTASTTATPVPTGTPAPTPAPVAGIMRANEFLNTLGVTSHIVQQGLTPAQFDADMDYLGGIRHVRDDFTCDGCDPHNWNANFFIPEHQRRGVTFVGMPYTSIGTTFLQWDQLGAAGALFAVEGPNEPNNQPFTYNGIVCNQSSTFQGCLNFQRDLLAATRADANTSTLPMFSITEVGAEPDNVGLQFIAGFANYANLHNYVKGNDNKMQDNRAWAAEAPDAAEQCCFDGMDGEFVGTTWSKHFPASPYGTGASIPRVTTETGWDSTSGLSADQIGKVLVNVLLSGAARGWAWTFIYQLQDDKDSFGLFTNTATPKPAATYIKNLLAILADNSSAFTPVVVPYTIAPLPATVHSLLMQKSDGHYELAVWDDRPVGEGTDNVTVNLGSTYATVSLYDMTSGTTPQQTLTTNAVTLILSDHAMIVEFK